MIKPLTRPQGSRPPLRGICLVVTDNENTPNSPVAPVAATKFPQRPDARALSEAIPLFFIGRNKNGLWVAREPAVFFCSSGRRCGLQRKTACQSDA